MKKEGDDVRVHIDGGLRVPPGGVVVVSPLDGRRTVTGSVPARLLLRTGGPTSASARRFNCDLPEAIPMTLPIPAATATGTSRPMAASTS